MPLLSSLKHINAVFEVLVDVIGTASMIVKSLHDSNFAGKSIPPPLEVGPVYLTHGFNISDCKSLMSVVSE